MKRHEQLSPPRPGRGELFYAAERYLERNARVDHVLPASEVAANHLLASNGIIGYAAIGSMYGRTLTRLFEERRAAAQARADEATLMTELVCRDITPFECVEALARHIIEAERP